MSVCVYVRSQGLVFSVVVDLPRSPVFQTTNTEYRTRPAQPSSRFLAFILAMAVIASTSSQSLKKVPNNLSCGNSVKQDEGASFKSNGISDCRNKCEASTKCLAIIFWQEDNFCSIFHNWCEKPGTIRKWVSVFQKPYTAPKATTTTTTTKAATTAATTAPPQSFIYIRSDALKGCTTGERETTMGECIIARHYFRRPGVYHSRPAEIKVDKFLAQAPSGCYYYVDGKELHFNHGHTDLKKLFAGDEPICKVPGTGLGLY